MLNQENFAFIVYKKVFVSAQDFYFSPFYVTKSQVFRLGDSKLCTHVCLPVFRWTSQTSPICLLV